MWNNGNGSTFVEGKPILYYEYKCKIIHFKTIKKIDLQI